MKFRIMCFAILLSCVLSPLVSADYANITIDGNFADWNNVAIFATDPAGDNGSGVDYVSLQIANDDNFFYYRFEVATAIDTNAAFAGGDFSSVRALIDVDNNTGTGHDLFGAGLIGVEAGYAGDFSFESSTASLDVGAPNPAITSTGLVRNIDTSTTSVEVSIPRNAIITSSGAALFPATGQTIGFQLFTDTPPDFATADLIGGSYTLMPASVPEPGSLALIATGMLGLVARRRRS